MARKGITRVGAGRVARAAPGASRDPGVRAPSSPALPPPTPPAGGSVPGRARRGGVWSFVRGSFPTGRTMRTQRRVLGEGRDLLRLNRAVPVLVLGALAIVLLGNLAPPLLRRPGTFLLTILVVCAYLWRTGELRDLPRQAREARRALRAGDTPASYDTWPGTWALALARLLLRAGPPRGPRSK